MLKQTFILTFLLITAVSHADEADTSDLLSFVDSGLYDCAPISQVKMVVSENKKMNVVPSVCIYDVKCKGKDRRAKYKSMPFVSHCRLDGENCKDFSDCISEQREEIKNPTMSYLKAQIERVEPEPERKDLYGHECKYSWGTPLVIYRQIPGKEAWDTVCASPISGCKLPESIKGSFLATCKASKEIKPGLMECPAPQNCLADAIPVTRGYTKSEAKALAASGSRTQKESATSTTSVTVVGASLGGNGTNPTHLVPKK